MSAQNPDMPDRLCAFCQKIVVQIPPGSEVREGEKVFHLDCYVLYKRRATKP